MDTPQPQPQPSQAPTPQGSFPVRHSHTVFWIFLILSLVLVVVIAVFAFQTLQGKSEAEQRVTEATTELQTVQSELAMEMLNLEEAQDRVQEVEDSVPPFFYNRIDETDSEIHMVNRITGEDALVQISAEGHWRIIAATELNYDGRIFVMDVPIVSEGGGYPYVFNVNEGGSPTLLPFVNELPAVSTGDNTLISPDGEHLVAAYDNPENGDTEKNVVIWNMLTGESEEIGRVAQDEYLAEFVGPGAFGGANGFNMFWTSLECVRVNVYEDAEVAEGEEVPVRKEYKETREFCRS